MIRGRDISRWYSKPSEFIITPYENKSGTVITVINEKSFKLDYPKAYQFFLNFKDKLMKRAMPQLWKGNNPFIFYMI